MHSRAFGTFYISGGAVTSNQYILILLSCKRNENFFIIHFRKFFKSEL